LMGNMWCCSVQEIVPVNTFSYKNAFSIALFALVDANYHFMFADAACQGIISDSGVFTNTEPCKKTRSKLYLR
jgi:hypothetical protein